MTVTTPTAPPSNCRAGDTLKWIHAESDFVAGTDTLEAVIVGREGRAAATVAQHQSGSTWLITFAAADTKKLPPADDYTLAIRATDAATSEEYTTLTQPLPVLANLNDQAEGFDNRTQNQRTLDAVNAVIEGRASKDQESYAIGGRSLSRTPLRDLIDLRREYERLVAKDIRAERAKAGKGHRGRILARFN